MSKCPCCGQPVEPEPIDSMTSKEIEAAIKEWSDAFKQYQRRMNPRKAQ